MRESETRFRTMLDAAPVMIWMSDTNKLCNFFNQGWLNFTGRPLQEELGEGWVRGEDNEYTGVGFETRIHDGVWEDMGKLYISV